MKTTFISKLCKQNMSYECLHFSVFHTCHSPWALDLTLAILGPTRAWTCLQHTLSLSSPHHFSWSFPPNPCFELWWINTSDIEIISSACLLLCSEFQPHSQDMINTLHNSLPASLSSPFAEFFLFATSEHFSALRENFLFILAPI